MSIWKHREIRKSLDRTDYLTLDEGNTPLVKLENSDTNIFVKRDDLNPTGSWKDRGSAYKINSLINSGIKSGVIASSGNAAISLITYLNKFAPDFKLFVVVSKNVNQEKLNKLNVVIENTNHEVIISENSRKESNEIAAQNSIPNLRSSIDDEIVKGYWSLGFELADEVMKNQVDSIFIPVSSGTAFVGIAQGLFLRFEKPEKMPKLIAVQTQSTFPVFAAWKASSNDTETATLSPLRQAQGDGKGVEMTSHPEQVEGSLANAIIDKTALRSPQILKAIRETNGYAVTINNDEIQNARKFAKENGFDLSNTSLLSIAAALKDKNSKSAICIASGL